MLNRLKRAGQVLFGANEDEDYEKLVTMKGNKEEVAPEDIDVLLGNNKKKVASNVKTATQPQIKLYNKLVAEKGLTLDDNHANWTRAKMSSEISRLMKVNSTSSANSKPANSKASGPSPRQIDLYKKLCDEKNQKINPVYTDWTSKQMSDELTRLMKKESFTKATKNQITKLVELTERLDMPKPAEDKLNSMSIKQASSMIETLIKQDETHNSRPTDAQISLIEDMFASGTVLPEQLIPVHPTLLKEKEELLILNKKFYADNINSIEIDGIVYTKSEVQDELVKKTAEIEKTISEYDLTTLDRTEVGNFIQSNSKNFYEWKDDQVSEKQIEFIQDLQSRIANIYKWHVGEETADITGKSTGREIISDEAIRTGQYKLSVEELKMFRGSEARDLIEILLKEERDPSLTSGFVDNSINQKEMRNSFIALDDLTNLSEEELEKVNNMFHSLYAIIGQEAEEDILNATDVEESLLEVIRLCNLYESKETLIAVTQDIIAPEYMEKILA